MKYKTATYNCVPLTVYVREWMEWISMDEDGSVCCFSEKPMWDGKSWVFGASTYMDEADLIAHWANLDGGDVIKDIQPSKSLRRLK